MKLSAAATLAPLSVILQLLPPIYLTPWFMRIDFVAVPWIVCWLLFGFDSALLCLLVSVPLVGALGPFAGGWVGAIMKSVSTVWMFAVPAIFARKMGKENFLSNRIAIVFSSIISIVVRDAVTTIFNLYFAIPIFFGMSTQELLQWFTNPRFQSFLGVSLGLTGYTAYFAEVVFWNTTQGIVDLTSSFSVGSVLGRKRLLT